MPAIALLSPPRTFAPGPTPSWREAAPGARHDPRRTAWKSAELLEPLGAAGETAGEGVVRAWSLPTECFPATAQRPPLSFRASAFLAQHIAQEVLSAGLYREAWDAGAAAYARAAADFPASRPATEVSLAI